MSEEAARSLRASRAELVHASEDLQQVANNITEINPKYARLLEAIGELSTIVFTMTGEVMNGNVRMLQATAFQDKAESLFCKKIRSPGENTQEILKHFGAAATAIAESRVTFPPEIPTEGRLDNVREDFEESQEHLALTQNFISGAEDGLQQAIAATNDYITRTLGLPE